MVRGGILPIAAVLFVLCGIAAANSGAFLGVIPENVDEGVAKKLNYKGRGVYVPEVVTDGPAQKAGMEDRDIIIEMGGDKMLGTGHLRDFLSYHSPGDKIEVKVWRNGKTKSLSVELGERERAFKDVERTIVIRGEPKAWLGIRMQSLTLQLAEHFGTDQGVLISEVIEGSPAETAGLEAGDVITRIGDGEVEEPFCVSTILADFEPGDKVEIRFVRNGKSMTKEIELGETPEEHRKTEPHVFTWDGEHMKVPGLDYLYIPKPPDVPIPQIEIPELELEFQEQLESLKEQGEELKQLKAELKQEMEHLREEIESLKRQLEESE